MAYNYRDRTRTSERPNVEPQTESQNVRSSQPASKSLEEQLEKLNNLTTELQKSKETVTMGVLQLEELTKKLNVDLEQWADGAAEVFTNQFLRDVTPTIKAQKDALDGINRKIESTNESVSKIKGMKSLKVALILLVITNVALVAYAVYTLFFI